MLDPTKSINGINTDPESALGKEKHGKRKNQGWKVSHGKLVHWRDKSDTSLTEGEGAEVRERPAKQRGFDSRQEVSKLPA